MGEAEQKVLIDCIPEENAITVIRDIECEVSKLFLKIELKVCCNSIEKNSLFCTAF